MSPRGSSSSSRSRIRPTAHFASTSTTSRDRAPQYRVDVKREGSDEWTTLEQVTDNTQRNRPHKLTGGKPITAVRLWQVPGGGSPNRPNLLWIAQVVWE